MYQFAKSNFHLDWLLYTALYPIFSRESGVVYQFASVDRARARHAGGSAGLGFKLIHRLAYAGIACATPLPYHARPYDAQYRKADLV